MTALPRAAWLAAAGLFAVLAAFGGRYGYHRDELYFLEAGRHPAWGYPDQPPLVPLLAVGWDQTLGGSLWSFRLVPALVAALVVLVAALTAAELGATRREQAWTAVLAAVCACVVAIGHLFSTTTFDVLGTATVVLLVLRALNAAGTGATLSRWLAAGLVAGITLQVKTLIGVLLACALVALLVTGPRRELLRPGPWLGALLAAAIGAPYLVWQAAHGWPQLDVAANIAAGGSASSSSRATVVPEQLLIAGPVVGVVLVIGLVALLRGPRFRWLGVTYLLMLAVVVVTGGKAYYLAGLFPAMLAAGVPPLLRFVDRSRTRRVAAGLLLAVHGAGTAVIALPLAPPSSPVTEAAVAVNPDLAETVGWDEYTAQVETLAREHGAMIVTRNYGEAGALHLAQRRGSWRTGVYSGHNAYAEWGPPLTGTAGTEVLLVGRFPPDQVARWFTGCREIARITNSAGLENEELGAPIRLCTSAATDWAEIWPHLRHLG